MPALNEETLLGDCLQSLKAQLCDFEYEIVVVDNGSDDGTAAIAEKYGARIVHEGRRGVAMARAAGFAQARGNIIASTDADTVVPPLWLARMRRVFADIPAAVGVGGQWEFVDGPASLRWLIRSVNRTMPLVVRFAPWLWSFSGVNFAVIRDAYEACGGFNMDLEYGEDWDLGRRLRKLGPVIVAYDSLVKTSGRAFDKDPLCIRAVLNYLSLVVLGKTLLPPLMRRRAY